MEQAAGPTRRAVLAGGARLAAALLAGEALAACRQLPVIGRGAPDRDVVLADEAADRERVLLAAYDAAMTAVPALVPRLSPLRAEHAEHLAALVPGVAPAATPSPAPTGPPLRVPAVPADAAGALAVLRALETDTADRHGGAAVRSGRGLAVVLASAAASEASHVQVLA